MDVKGSYEKGRMYRGNGRWAKVMSTRCLGMASVAYGSEGELKAHAVSSETIHGFRGNFRPPRGALAKLERLIRDYDASARRYIESGEELY